MADEEEEESDWSLREVEEELRSNYTTLSNLIFFPCQNYFLCSTGARRRMVKRRGGEALRIAKDCSSARSGVIPRKHNLSFVLLSYSFVHQFVQ